MIILVPQCVLLLRSFSLTEMCACSLVGEWSYSGTIDQAKSAKTENYACVNMVVGGR